MTKKRYDLTQGPIFQKLVTLSLPIMATSFMQMAHNMANMFWLGRLGREYVAAAGLAGQFLWLAMAFMLMCRIGAEIGVSQNMGQGKPETAREYAQSGFILAIFIGALFTILVVAARSYLIRFFNMDDPQVVAVAKQYLSVVALSLPFTFAHFVITGVYGGYGNTKIPFYINSFALALNIVLAPVLIFILGFGIYGAAISMIVANAANLSLKLWAMKKYKDRPFEQYSIFIKVAWDKIIQILRWGVPVAVESFLFTTLFMVVSRLIASGFGVGAVAAHNVAMNIESLAFMAAGGFASAITAFMGQNFGAKKWGRMRSTYKVATLVMAVYGLVVTVALFSFATPLVSIFLDDPADIIIGRDYLRIIGLAQLLFCMEGVATGSFRGQGLTYKPTIVSVSSNVLRVIITYILAATVLGINGVWIGIALAMTFRSVWMLLWHFISARKLPKVDAV
ncbi:MAG: MATE family efflux transporter [Firmicutes bacterium]|nr:MATE family efflux transporter [Bacillota bacterium]